MRGHAYSGSGSAAAGANKTLINLIASTSRAGGIYEFTLSCATSTSQNGVWRLQRNTAVGTEGSGFTPIPLHPDSPAASLDFGIAHSVEPTYTATDILMEFALNQLNIFRWVAYDDDAAFYTNKTSGNGIGLKCNAVEAGTDTHHATMKYFE